jgi:hypothetical protein
MIFDQHEGVLQLKAATFLTKVSILFSVVAIMFAVSGCRQGDTGTSSDCAVRIVNSVRDSDSISAKVNGKDVVKDLAYRTGTPFKGVNPGTYSMAVKIDRNSFDAQTVTADNVTVDSGHWYTAVVMGQPGGNPPAKVMILDDPKVSTAPSDQAQVTFFNASQDAGNVDVLINSIVAFKNVPYGSRTTTTNLAALPYEWAVKVAGDDYSPLMDPVTLKLSAGHRYLVVLTGGTADTSIGLTAYSDK